MPKSSKPKKKYKPKVMRDLPINIRFSKDTELKLSLIPHECLRNFKEGRQTESDWHVLASRVNLGSTLVRNHFPDNEDAVNVANLALEALLSSWDRYRRLGKVGMTGEEYNRIADAINLTDDMQAMCSRRELDEAMNQVFRDAAIIEKRFEPPHQPSSPPPAA